MMRMNNFIGRNVGPIILSFALIASVALYFINDGVYEARLNEQNATIVKLKAEKDSVVAEFSDAEAKVAKDVTSLDTMKKFNDDRIAKKLFEMAFTWDSGDSYNKARDAVMKNYGITADSQFMMSIMPSLQEYTIAGYKGTAGDGVAHNIIDDDDLNMRFRDATTYVTAIGSDGSYSYFAVVETYSTDSKKAKGSGLFTLTYDIDPDGNIKNLAGYGSKLMF